MHSRTAASRCKALALASSALCAFGAGLALPATSFGAEAADAAKAAPNAGQVEELVVTAQLRSEKLQDVPVTVNVVTGTSLAERNFHDLQQLQFTNASIQVNGRAGPGVNDYFIRGIGTGVFSNTIQYDVSIVLDGVSLGLPEMSLLQYFDVDRIETLSGPQPTLFGKNSSAGVISIITKRPELGVYGGTANASVASMNTAGAGWSERAEAVVNIPVSANSALRIGGFDTHTDPLVKDVLPNNAVHQAFDEWGVQAKYLWQPNDRFHLYLSADYGHERGLYTGAATWRLLSPATFAGRTLAASLVPFGIVPGPDNIRNSADGATGDGGSEAGGAQAEVGYNFANGFMLTDILAYRFFGPTGNSGNNDADFSSIDYANTLVTPRYDDQYSNELRLASPTGGVLEGQGGVYYSWGRFVRNSAAVQDGVGRDQNGNLLPAGITAFRGGQQFSRQVAETTSVYGQFTVHPTSDLSLIAGARYTHDSINLDVTNQACSFCLVQFFTPVNSPLRQSRQEDNLSYKFGAQYTFAPNDMVYATYTKGYKGPAFNNTASSLQAISVEPEIPTAWEVGLKSSLFDRRLTLNLSAFYEKFVNYQQATLDPVRAAVLIQNVGALVSKGLEAQFDARPTDHLTLSGSLAYIDAVADKFPNATCYTGQTAAQGCITVRPAAPGVPAIQFFDASGQTIAQAPKFTASATGRYTWRVADGFDGFASLSGYYRTKTFFGTPNTDPNTRVPAYFRLDGQIGIAGNGRWKVALYANNLLDKRVAMYIQTNTTAPGSYQQSFSDSSFRTIGVSASLKY
jgi:iron complex outermembrane receptor protein